jgi:hypothetical protein
MKVNIKMAVEPDPLALNLGEVQGRVLKTKLLVCLFFQSSSRPLTATSLATPQKPPSALGTLLPSPNIPTPVFYDKSDTKDSPEVRPPLLNLFSTTSSMTTSEQQNCEICHKKNRGEEMLLCDGCDCGMSSSSALPLS